MTPNLATKVWLNTREAAEYTSRPNRKAFRHWAYRHGIVISKGLVSRVDIDAAILRKRS